MIAAPQPSDNNKLPRVVTMKQMLSRSSPFPAEPEECTVEFSLDFQFRSSIYQALSSLFLNQVAKGMVIAFEQRCLTHASHYSLLERL